MDLSSAESVRAFLALCLNPRPGHERSPAELARILPGPVAEAVALYAPALAPLQLESASRQEAARRAEDAYADAFAAWIRDEPLPAPQIAQEDPARIDRLRPSFRTHASLEAIDAQIARAKRQSGRWEVRLATLTALRLERVAQLQEGTWPPPVEAPAPGEGGSCPQNRRGDKRVMQPHFYSPDSLQCVFCHVPVIVGGGPDRAVRTPDGRVWTLAAERSEHGVPLYEAPFVNTRYTALALETLHGEIVPTDPPAPLYVLNSRSVNQSPATAVKHIPDGAGHTLCPPSFVASAPLEEETAAEYALCGGCRQALLNRYETTTPA
jgi:hypothetical protein